MFATIACRLLNNLSTVGKLLENNRQTADSHWQTF